MKKQSDKGGIKERTARYVGDSKGNEQDSNEKSKRKNRSK